MGRKWLLLIVSMGMIFWSSESLAKEAHSWSELDQIAGQMLQFTKQDKIDEAKQLTSVFADELNEYSFEDQVWSMSALRTLVTTFEHADRALTSEEMTDAERFRLVTSFRLTVDSFLENDNPLWNQMELSIMDSLDRLDQAISSNDQTDFNHELNEYRSIYAMVRPAIQITVDGDQVQTLDDYNHFFLTSSLTDRELEDHVHEMRQSYQSLFHTNGKDEADPMIYWVMFTIGAPVILSLSYVGFRKYKAEKRKVKAKE